MSDGLRYSLVACDGSRLGHTLGIDDLEGAVFFLHMVYGLGYSAWLRDTEQDVLVGGTNAGCPSCALDCGEFLDLATDEASSAFWTHLLGRQS